MFLFNCFGGILLSTINRLILSSAEFSSKCGVFIWKFRLLLRIQANLHIIFIWSIRGDWSSFLHNSRSTQFRFIIIKQPEDMWLKFHFVCYPHQWTWKQVELIEARNASFCLQLKRSKITKGQRREIICSILIVWRYFFTF